MTFQIAIQLRLALNYLIEHLHNNLTKLTRQLKISVMIIYIPWWDHIPSQRMDNFQLKARSI